MKQRMQGMVAGVLVTVLLLGAVTVFAAATQTIEVTFGNIRTTLWGNEFVVRDDDGLVIDPFMYEGRAYFPVETVLRAMGSNAQWDKETRTLNFGAVEQPLSARERVALQQAAPFFESGGNQGLPPEPSWVRQDITHSTTTGSVVMGGRTYAGAIVFNAIGTEVAPGGGIYRFQRAHQVQHFSSHNLNGEYRMLTGYIGREDGSEPANATFNIFGDGVLLHTSNIIVGELPVEVAVSVEGVRLLRLEVIYEHVGTAGRTVAFAGFLQR